MSRDTRPRGGGSVDFWSKTQAGAELVHTVHNSASRKASGCTVDLQFFGTIDTTQGPDRAMLCIDGDRPAEYMFQWAYDGSPPLAPGMGVRADGAWEGELLKLTPACVFRTNESGALYAPTWQQLTAEERQAGRELRAELGRTPIGGLTGRWTGPNGTAGAITLDPPPRANRVTARRCRSWNGFKDWAVRIQADGAAWYRGHGCRSFALRTSLHRLGRTRLERYCAEELIRFKGHAEALLSRRFNLGDASDYATVLGLAQHHGLPTPLLDWTASPYIAAFFAFADAIENGHSRPRSTHVRVYALSRRLVGGIAPPVVTVPYVRPYVVALQIAPIHNPRLYAQQGTFLVTNVVDLEGHICEADRELGRQDLFAVDVPISCADEALKDLAFMGLTAATMFPGLDGIGRMMRHQMSLNPPA
jgi:FRG domain